MKRDNLLQHQLARLNRIGRLKSPCFDLSGDRMWIERWSALYKSAINHSLRRFARSL